MRRKPDALLPLELSILEAGIDLRRHGVSEFHGFLIAKEIKEREDARLRTMDNRWLNWLEIPS